MLNEFTTWLATLVKSAFDSLWALLKDGFIFLVDGVLSALGNLIAAIPVPDWMAQGLQSLFSALDGGTMWIVSSAGLPQCLAIIGAGFVFRLLRKAATLFQW